MCSHEEEKNEKIAEELYLFVVYKSETVCRCYEFLPAHETVVVHVVSFVQTPKVVMLADKRDINQKIHWKKSFPKDCFLQPGILHDVNQELFLYPIVELVYCYVAEENTWGYCLLRKTRGVIVTEGNTWGYSY